jgi:chemotaxis response regulator CheB
VAAIRVMLGKMPAMLRGILEETFAGQGDIMLVGLSDSRPSLSELVTAHNPDVLIVGVERADWATGFAELFVDHPSLRILAIGEDGRSAMMQELYIRRWRVADLSPRSIVAAVRASLETRNDIIDVPTSGARP